MARYTPLVTPTVFGCKLKRIERAIFSQVLSTDNFVMFGHPWGMASKCSALNYIPEILERTLN